MSALAPRRRRLRCRAEIRRGRHRNRTDGCHGFHPVGLPVGRSESWPRGRPSPLNCPAYPKAINWAWGTAATGADEDRTGSLAYSYLNTSALLSRPGTLACVGTAGGGRPAAGEATGDPGLD